MLQKLDELARADGFTRNQLELAALDDFLTARRRPSAAERAPWLSNYLDRCGQADDA